MQLSLSALVCKPDDALRVTGCFAQIWDAAAAPSTSVLTILLIVGSARSSGGCCTVTVGPICTCREARTRYACYGHQSRRPGTLTYTAVGEIIERRDRSITPEALTPRAEGLAADSMGRER
jgi:hypothetical protein